MSGLEIAFYIVGLVFMGLSLIITAGLLIAILALRMKVHAIEENLRQKIDLASSALGALATFSPLFKVVRRLVKLRRLLK